MKTETRKVTTELLKRCQQHFLEDSSEYNLAERGITNKKLPLDKISRWLGYLQGTLIAGGVMDVQTERDFSRVLFKEAYKTEEKEFYKEYYENS